MPRGRSQKSAENWIGCKVCGKEYYRAPSKIKDGSSCCSIKCRGILQRTNQPPSTDIPGVKKWLRTRNMIKECEDCGYNEHPEILVVHHRDRDRTNNALFNLAILCPNCHALEHYSENKKGWTHASTKRKRSRDDKLEHSRDV